MVSLLLNYEEGTVTMGVIVHFFSDTAEHSGVGSTLGLQLLVPSGGTAYVDCREVCGLPTSL